MQSANSCTLCKGPHKTHRCPDLTDPLAEGFYKGGAPPSGGHDHDDDEGVKVDYDDAITANQQISIRH